MTYKDSLKHVSNQAKETKFGCQSECDENHVPNVMDYMMTFCAFVRTDQVSLNTTFMIPNVNFELY